MPVKALINLKNLIYNAKAIRKKLPAGVKFCAVVKADAYGHGAEKVAGAIYLIADCFAVATAEEGAALRLSGIDKEILVLTAVPRQDVPQAVNYGLTLTAGGICDLKAYEKVGKELGANVNVHLKFDTGMNRQGFKDLEQLKAAFDFCEKSTVLSAVGLYSHFACPENESLRQAAAKKFSLAKKVAERYNNKERKIVCHISASGGFIAGEYCDMVRIGILLYGYKPFPTDAIRVKPVMSVYAPVITQKTIKRGECALYGEKRAEKDTEVSLIRYGYADGLFRKEISGQFNNRCMDATAATGVKKGAKRAAVMTDANALAEKYGTISYEILVKCALRAEKIYLK
ncbi:MAG: alanine racemase [Clostridia bacterium]|nr:alanine racemase [Clostridia bacterium]